MITHIILPILGSVMFVYIAVSAWFIFQPERDREQEPADSKGARAARRRRR